MPSWAELVANCIAVIEKVVRDFEVAGNQIRAINLQVTDSPALPIYKEAAPEKLVPQIASEQKEVSKKKSTAAKKAKRVRGMKVDPKKEDKEVKAVKISKVAVVEPKKAGQTSVRKSKKKTIM